MFKRAQLTSGIAKSIYSLMSIQVGSYILPLISIPYLTRVLSVEHWGLYTWAQLFGIIGGLFIEYGFGMSATREVARHKADQEKVREIFSNVMSVKFLMALVVLPIMLSIGLLIDDFKTAPIYMIGAMMITFVNGMNSLWVFHGKEKMGKPSVVFVIGAACFTASIFFLVKSPEDGWIALLTQVIFYFLASSFLFIWAVRDNGWVRPQMHLMKQLLVDGWSLFISRIAVMLYSQSFAFVLGVMTNPVSVGIYTGAEKLFRAVFYLLSPVSLALFPRMSQLLKEDEASGKKFLQKMALLMMAGSVLTALGLYFTADWLIPLFLGDKYTESIPLFKIGIMAMPLIAANTAITTQWLIPLGLDKEYNKGVLVLGVSTLVYLPLMIMWKAEVGATLSILIAEALSIVIFVIMGKRLGKSLF